MNHIIISMNHIIISQSILAGVAISLYSFGHWIGGTVAVVLTVLVEVSEYEPSPSDDNPPREGLNTEDL